MAVDLKTLFQNYNTKVAEKINALKSEIDTLAANGTGGGGISADAGNSLTLGSDSKAYYSELTAEEIKALLYALDNVNQYTDADVLTLQSLVDQMPGKADLDPNTGRLVAEQMPYYNITNSIAVDETTLADFLLVTAAYVYEEGDVIVINDGFGNIEHWLYNGGDRTLETSYSAISPAQIKFYNTGTDRPNPGDSGFLYYVRDAQALYAWDAGTTAYVQIGGGSVTSHDSLTGLQGGAAGEYYHLTAAEYTNLQSLQGDQHFSFSQGTASDTWVIAHNLNKYPSVTIVDSAGSVVEGAIEYTDANNLIVYFSGGFSGTAYLN